MNAGKKKGLGRGLSALFGDSTPKEKIQISKQNSLIPIADLSRNPYQPRQNFKEEKLEELVNSIKKNGIIQPIAVRPNKTENGKYKGIILQFHDGHEPIYKYPPFQINKKEFEKWSDKCIEENSSLTWIGCTYWYLDVFTCALVLRNKEWFKEVKPLIQNVWDTIVKERVSGYEHRKPKKRVKKEKPQQITNVIKIDI